MDYNSYLPDTYKECYRCIDVTHVIILDFIHSSPLILYSITKRKWEKKHSGSHSKDNVYSSKSIFFLKKFRKYKQLFSSQSFTSTQ